MIQAALLRKAFAIAAGIAGILCIQALPHTVNAETIEVAQQGNQAIATPQNGMKMDAVMAQYGEPLQKIAAVGNPPISRWVYSDFTVYFEFEIVLHSVVHPAPTQNQ